MLSIKLQYTRKIWYSICLVGLIITISQPNLSIAIDDDFLYELGGALPIGRSATNRPNTARIGAGLAWNTDLMCGNFDIRTSVSNQLNGISGAFQNMMGNIIQSATGAVASLPALAIQKLNPALYDLLQNGVLPVSYTHLTLPTILLV